MEVVLVQTEKYFFVMKKRRIHLVCFRVFVGGLAPVTVEVDAYLAIRYNCPELLDCRSMCLQHVVHTIVRLPL